MQWFKPFQKEREAWCIGLSLLRS
ncbi:hypothetical protein Pint_22308 [Pistacia integerrima]|uniref:Uncharacterized protein n=2 Tax=Pistacia TaxID=55512 RepID=A0ACC1B672_9ROSI|nr:hypothetical protein Pint_22308 [Pistacia integerrima]KAJ0094398.1 hypothetical protein Patl1_15438 [Pistacia atlantica]